MNITPAILARTFEEVNSKLFALEGLSKRVQIDVSDGVFGKKRTWIPEEGEVLPHGFEYEFDMMVEDWRTHIPRVITLGAGRIVAHIDHFTPADLDDLVTMVKGKKIPLGLSISNTTKIDFLIEALHLAQAQYAKVYAQLMGIRTIGVQGQPFDEEVLQRIARIREEFPSIMIQVDGSMNDVTIKKIKQVDADTAVVGSFLFREGTPSKAFLLLKKI
jgi:ribulose-phosphate 3-epimerase